MKCFTTISVAEVCVRLQEMFTKRIDIGYVSFGLIRIS